MLEPLRTLMEHAGDGAASPAELQEGVSRAKAELADSEERLRELLETRRIHQRVGAREDAKRVKQKIVDTRREIARWQAAKRKLAELLDERTEIET